MTRRRATLRTVKPEALMFGTHCCLCEKHQEPGSTVIALQGKRVCLACGDAVAKAVKHRSEASKV